MTRKLANPPIQEAIIDIQCNTDNQVPVSALEFDLKGFVRENMNRLHAELQFSSQFQFDIKQATSSSHYGYRYTDDENNIVLQYRKNGVTTSKLRPYDCWETFLPVAESNWSRYKEAMGIESVKDVSRLAVRYINRLEVPGPAIHIQDYLTNAPETPDETNRAEVDDFFCRMVIPVREIQGSVILTTTSEDWVLKGEYPVRPFVLDIDVFTTTQEIKLESEEQMWFIINNMRDIKNEMFFNVMGDKALELCE